MASVKDTIPGQKGPQMAAVEAWFHFENNFYFVRREDGSVSIEQWAPGQEPTMFKPDVPKSPIPMWRLHLPKDSWVSVIGAMSKTHRESFELPYQFHMGVKPNQEAT